MISGLKGSVIKISSGIVSLDVSGVVYSVNCTSSKISELEIDQAAFVETYLDVQETSLNLYGFVDSLEVQLFHLLISVSGIGAKSAVEILSKEDRFNLIKMLADADSTALKKIKGIGPKTADRLILELKDKVSNLLGSGLARELPVGAKVSQEKAEGVPNNMVLEEARLALEALGFSSRKASEAINKISKLENIPKESGEVVRIALSGIS